MHTSLAVLVLGLLAISSFAYGSNQTGLNAGVTVQCPFILRLGAHPVYTSSSNQIGNFTIYTSYNCTIHDMNGYFSILESNGTSVYTLPISSINVSENPVPYNFKFDASTVPAGNYTAKLLFSYANFTNTQNATIRVYKQANINITSFNTSQNIMQRSPQYFYFTINNTGSYALANSINVRIRITGPVDSVIIIPSNYSLLPSQTHSFTVTSYNSTRLPGKYRAILNITYLVNKIPQSKYASINYTVSAPRTSQPVSEPFIQIPKFSLLAFPFLVSLFTGSSKSEIVSIRNDGNATEYVDFAVAPVYSSMLGLSATNLSIEPKQTVGISTVVSAANTLSQGQYIIPVNVTVGIGQTVTKETLYVTLEVSHPMFASAVHSITLVNNTNNATGVVIINNPTTKNLTNVVVKTIIPSSVVKNSSHISAYGLPHFISTVNGSYVINWYIGALPKNSSTYAYFTLANMMNYPSLAHVAEVIAAPSTAIPSSILRVLSISAPTFYAGTENTIALTAFYSGIVPQSVIAYLTGPSDVIIYNSTQRVNATPNSVFVENFAVKPSSAGTTIMNMHIGTIGANLSYEIPLMVLAKPPVTTTTIPATQQAHKAPLIAYGVYGVYGIIFLVIIIISIAVAKSMNKPKYSSQRAAKLKRLREAMRRTK
ncbi:MAG: hypothetical protein M1465_02600 [Candidatus Marsarchaeota archaeon]|nr:hypothetical protein [Candidatus Marsarchaeota archaeon]